MNTFGKARSVIDPVIDFATETFKYGDVILGKVRKNGSNGLYSNSIAIFNGPTFE